MQVGPTVDGRIKVSVEREEDMLLLYQLISDSSHDENVENLIGQIGSKVTDEDWDEFVKPELITQFNADILHVSNAIKALDDSDEDDLFIDSEHSQKWYSTLNQARLSLENDFELSKVKYDFDPKTLLEEQQWPLIKDNFYLFLQDLIINHLEL